MSCYDLYFCILLRFFFFFFNDTATTEIYTLSLHDALPICYPEQPAHSNQELLPILDSEGYDARCGIRSEEHTSELQSLRHLVCRLLLEKKKTKKKTNKPNKQ